ncbi:MAG TPA: ABC transporter permease [Acidimicrobiales bacterium]|nr:ABC transporter permease [Acidimicrobiales bacterium]
MTKVLAFFRFELLRLLQSWRFLAITVAFPVLFYFLLLGNHPAGHTVDGSVPWNVYLMVAMSSFGAMVASLNAAGSRLAVERVNGWARQLRVTPLPSWTYVVTKVGVTMVVVLPIVVLVEVVGAAAGGVHLSAARWAELTILMWVAALPFAALGVFVGFVVTAETVYPVITGLMFVLGYLGGLFTPVNDLPGSLRTVAQALPSFQHVALGLDAVQGRPIDSAHWLVLAGYGALLAAAVVWRHRAEESRGLA